MPYSNITITIQTGLTFIPGQYVQVIHDENNYMFGQVVSYNSGTGQFIFEPVSYLGAGTFTSWTVVTSAAPGEN